MNMINTIIIDMEIKWVHRFMNDTLDAGNIYKKEF